MKKSKIYPLGLDLKYLLSIFESNGNMICKKSDNELILFEIYGNSNILEIEKILSKFFNTNLLVVTNHQGKKPLVLTATFSNNNIQNMWEFRVYQKGSKGIILNKFSTVSSMPEKLFEIIKSIENYIVHAKKLVDLELKFQKQFSDFEKHIYFLNDSDLKVLSNRGSITSFEKDQIVFTFDHYKSLFEKNPEMIDDGELYKAALELNSELKPILEVLISLISQYDINL